MFRNCLAAALRHLSRNRLYSAISVFGLAIGLWGALLTALTIRSQFTQSHFIPGFERIYQAIYSIDLPGLPARYSDTTLNSLASLLQLNVPQLQGATRLTSETLLLRHATVAAVEQVYWVDPNFFELLRLPLVAGDLAHALARPDGIVLPRSMARKYFGRDDPIGQTVMVADARQLMGKLSALGSPRPMVVTAVVEDMPENGTELHTGAFASGLASFSKLNQLDHDPTNLPGTHSFSSSVTTFLRLAPGASIENLRRSLQAANLRSLKYLMGAANFAKMGRPIMSLEPIRLDRINSHPGLHPDFRGRLITSIILGGLILLIACVNFINLMTARATRRSREVGIRKLAGAGRHLLMLQFLGESTLYVLTAMLTAVALTEWSLPYVNAFLGSDASFDYWRDAALLGSLLAATALLGVLAGAYPALIMSGFRPLSVLKGPGQASGAGWVRQCLVTLQFAILVALVIGATVIYRQRIYATTEALRIKPDQVLGIYSPCRAAFVSELKALPGVQAAACSGFQILGAGDTSSVKARDGSDVSMTDVPTDLTVFDLYGLKPLAGSFGAPGDPASSGQYVINESAVRQLHFASAQAAIGQKLDLPFFGQPGDNGKVHGMHIVGVVPDFTMDTVERPIPPTAYVVAPDVYNFISVKLTGRQLPQTLVAIERAWTRTGGEGPINRFFVNERIEQEYRSMLREAQGFGIFTVVAALLACLGLLGLAASIAEGRTREIGIRKALGADTSDVIRLLLWQFSRPVLWANLLAWPAAAWAMQRWLQGFAYHVELRLWVFPAAGGLALVIALLTVTTHSVLVARAKPVAALRYE